VPTLDDVAELAGRLPEVVQEQGRRGWSWSVRGKGFVWERPFSKADLKRFGDATPPGGPLLGVRVEDLGEREAVLSMYGPSVFTIAHFANYPAVLVQLDTVSPDALAELIEDAWLVCAPRALAEQYLKDQA
jgi:hypothetical protein